MCRAFPPAQLANALPRSSPPPPPRQACAAGTCMSDEALWAVACQAAQGLAFLHSHGVMHLDIKPDNIYRSAAGLPPQGPASAACCGGCAGGTWRIGDFGLAVARGQDGSMVRCVLPCGGGMPLRGRHGSADRSGWRQARLQAWLMATACRPRCLPQDWEEGDGDYVAPELLQAGCEPSERADIFSLGASLYECATGAGPGGKLGSWGGSGQVRLGSCAELRLWALGSPAAHGLTCPSPPNQLRCPASPCPAAGHKLPRSEGWGPGSAEAIEVPHRPPAFVALLRAMLQANPTLRPTAQQVVDVVARQQPAIAAAAAEPVAAAAAAAAVAEAAAAAARAAAAGQQGTVPAGSPLVPSPFQQMAECGSSAQASRAAAAPAAGAAAAAEAAQFSFDVPAAQPAGSFAFTPSQPLRPHNRWSSSGGPPGTAVKGTPVGRTRLGGPGRWAPALSPLISEGALTPGALASLAGLTPHASEGAPTPLLFGAAPASGGSSGSGGSRSRGPAGSAAVTPLDACRPAPLQLPHSAGVAVPSAGTGGALVSSSGTQDSRDGWRLSRRDIISPDSDLLNGGWVGVAGWVRKRRRQGSSWCGCPCKQCHSCRHGGRLAAAFRPSLLAASQPCPAPIPNRPAAPPIHRQAPTPRATTASAAARGAR